MCESSYSFALFGVAGLWMILVSRKALTAGSLRTFQWTTSRPAANALPLTIGRPDHPELLAQLIEDMTVVFAVALQQAGPLESFGHDLFVVRRLRLLVGHFQKEQKRDLLGVRRVGKPIILIG